MPTTTRSSGRSSGGRSSGQAAGRSADRSGAAAARGGGGEPKGRRAKAEARRRAKLAKLRARSGSRWRIHYDIEGPRVRLGLLWFAGAMAAFTVGIPGIVVYFGVAFGAAASHSARTWRARGHAADPPVALIAGAAVVASAGLGPRVMGIAVLALAVISVLAPVVRSRGDDGVRSVAARAGLLLQVTLPTAVSGGCLVLLADDRIWAAISLVLIVSAYEAGDFLIGSGATNSVEGPVAGGAAVLVTALAVAASGIAFEGVATAMLFGAAVAPLAFAGQLLGSAILPHARAFAPALRRVDSLLLAAPAWYIGLDRVVL